MDSQLLTFVEDLAGEARRLPGSLQGQRVGPIMGDTPHGEVARRTGPSSVASITTGSDRCELLLSGDF